MGDVSVAGMRLEELHLVVEGLIHRLVAEDVLLGAVDDTDKAELERVDAAVEDVEGVGACIHQVELCQDTDGPSALRVDLPRQPE